jgi:hypothetical protein
MPALVDLSARAQLAAGLPPGLDDGPGADTTHLRATHHETRVRAALAVGDLDRARALRDRSDAEGGPPLSAMARIEIGLLSGRLDLAEAALSGLAVDDGPRAEALICRPRATRLGTMLNEARVLAASGIDWDTDDADRLAAFADGFFLPARALLDRRPPTGADGAAPGPAIPDILHLVLPGEEMAACELERLVAAWRAATRRRVLCHDLARGATLVAEAAGADAARAYRMTRDPEQKADLLTLAALRKTGGVALRAPQWPGAGLDALVDGHAPGLVFRAGDGALSCDAMAFAAGHALPARALDMAVASCLSRDNDHRWFKTGPGLLTRAAACLDGAGTSRPAARAITLCPIHRLRRVVHPCAGIVRHKPAGPAQQPARALEAAVRGIAEPQAPGCMPSG